MLGSFDSVVVDYDKRLEIDIDLAYLKLASAKTPATRLRFWEKMQNLIKQRSPNKIRQMEDQQGLLD